MAARVELRKEEEEECSGFFATLTTGVGIGLSRLLGGLRDVMGKIVDEATG